MSNQVAELSSGCIMSYVCLARAGSSRGLPADAGTRCWPSIYGLACCFAAHCAQEVRVTPMHGRAVALVSTAGLSLTAEDGGSAGPGGPGAVPHPRRRRGVRGGAGVRLGAAAGRTGQRQSSRRGGKCRGRDVRTACRGRGTRPDRRRTEKQRQKKERSGERRDALPEGR